MDHKYNCVVQKATSVQQGKAKEQNKSKWNSHPRSL